MAALTEGQQQDLGRRDTGWSFLAEAMKMFGPTEITQELSKKLLKWQADVGGGSTKCATFTIQAVEAANLQVFMGSVKWDAELNIFHSMLKYNPKSHWK